MGFPTGFKHKGAMLWLLFGLFTPVNGLSCMSCTNAADIQECAVNTAQCTNSSTVVEKCYMDVTVLPSLQRVYSAGCRDISVCEILSSLAGKRITSKRQTIACAECCDTDPGQDGLHCNGKLCNLNITNVDLCKDKVDCSELIHLNICGQAYAGKYCEKSCNLCDCDDSKDVNCTELQTINICSSDFAKINCAKTCNLCYLGKYRKAGQGIILTPGPGFG